MSHLNSQRRTTDCQGHRADLVLAPSSSDNGTCRDFPKGGSFPIHPPSLLNILYTPRSSRSASPSRMTPVLEINAQAAQVPDPDPAEVRGSNVNRLQLGLPQDRTGGPRSDAVHKLSVNRVLRPAFPHHRLPGAEPGEGFMSISVGQLWLQAQSRLTVSHGTSYPERMKLGDIWPRWTL